MAPPQTSNCSLLLIYLPRKDERLSRPGWLTYSGRFTHRVLVYYIPYTGCRHRIEFKTATLCFKAVKLGTPSYLNNMLKPYAPLRALRSSNMDLLTVPRTDTSLGLRRFSVAGPQFWKRLPHELRQCNTISSFKSNLKTYYFRRLMDN